MSLEATDVADFLKQNPDFLLQNPGILAFVHLPGQGGGNVASLQERQVQTMRDKVKALEQKIVAMSRAAIENQAIIDGLQALQRELLRQREAEQLPPVAMQQIKKQFNVPMVKMALWAEPFKNHPALTEILRDIGEPSRKALAQMRTPYCGFSEKAPALDIFEDESVPPRSVVIIPLRIGYGPEVFGCVALGSPDKDRFSPGLGTDFLESLAEVLCAAMTRLS